MKKLLLLCSFISLNLFSQQWTALGGSGFTTGTSEYATIETYNNIPYIAFRDQSNGAKASVMKFNGTTWEYVGNAGFSDGVAGDTKIQFDNNGVLHVAFSDNSRSGKATVMKFNGTSWEVVGSAGFTAGNSFYYGFKFDKNNVPYLSYMDGVSGGGNKLSVKKFNSISNAWETVGTDRFSSSYVGWTSLAFDSNNKLYLAFQDGSQGQKASVMTFDGNNWLYVGSAGISTYGTNFTKLQITTNDSVYLSYSEPDNGYKSSFKKLDTSNNTWSTVYTTPAHAAPASIAIKGNELFAAYSTCPSSCFVTAKKYNSTTNTFEDYGTSPIENSAAEIVDLTFSSNGTPFLLYNAYSVNLKATVVTLDTSTLSVAIAAKKTLVASTLVDDVLSFQTNDNAVKRFTIYNAEGRLIKQGTTAKVNLVNVSGVKPGVYFLNIGNETIKFIKK